MADGKQTEQSKPIVLDNKTITKLAMAIAEAIRLQDNGEVVGPMTRKMLEHLDTIDSLDHFKHHTPAPRR